MTVKRKAIVAVDDDGKVYLQLNPDGTESVMLYDAQCQKMNESGMRSLVDGVLKSEVQRLAGLAKLFRGGSSEEESEE